MRGAAGWFTGLVSEVQNHQEALDASAEADFTQPHLRSSDSQSLEEGPDTCPPEQLPNTSPKTTLGATQVSHSSFGTGQARVRMQLHGPGRVNELHESGFQVQP